MPRALRIVCGTCDAAVTTNAVVVIKL